MIIGVTVNSALSEMAKNRITKKPIMTNEVLWFLLTLNGTKFTVFDNGIPTI